MVGVGELAGKRCVGRGRYPPSDHFKSKKGHLYFQLVIQWVSSEVCMITLSIWALNAPGYRLKLLPWGFWRVVILKDIIFGSFNYVEPNSYRKILIECGFGNFAVGDELVALQLLSTIRKFNRPFHFPIKWALSKVSTTTSSLSWGQSSFNDLKNMKIGTWNVTTLKHDNRISWLTNSYDSS